MWGGLKYCLRGLTQGLIYAGHNVAVYLFGNGVIIESFLRCWLPNSVWTNATELTLPPGCTQDGVVATNVHIFEGGETVADVNLPADASTAVLVETFPRFLTDAVYWNKKYTCKVGYRVTMWENGTESNCGSMDAVVDLYLTTDGAGVVTAVVQDVPPVPPAPTMLPGATMTIAASAGGFTVSAGRSPGLDCDVECNWWCVKFKDIT